CVASVTKVISHREIVQVATSWGNGDGFFAFYMTERNQIDMPVSWETHFTPTFVDACDLYRVPPLQRATAFGLAIYQAITAGKEAIDPLVAARTVLGCASRCAKVDPRSLEDRRRAT